MQRWSAPSSRAMGWAGLISYYSVRKLTYPSDQFPALAGLEAVSGELNTYDKCVSGMRISELLYYCGPSHSLMTSPKVRLRPRRRTSQIPPS
jgi:hypothetical protein